MDMIDAETRRKMLALHSIRSGTGGDWDTNPPAICNEDEDLWPCETLRLLGLPDQEPSGDRRVGHAAEDEVLDANG